MTQQSTPANLEALREQLVAYLDGELPAGASRLIEERLASDDAVRAELQRLSRPWDLLDELPRAELDVNFTQSTVEMIALASEADVAKLNERAPEQKRRRWVLAVAGLTSATATGFLVATLLWPHPNKALLNDLGVLEHYDEYRQAGDIQFLRQLAERHLFDEDPRPEVEPRP